MNQSKLQPARVRKPDWLKIKIGGSLQFASTKNVVEGQRMNTICHSGNCPNMGECWARGTATFMIAGDICTRSCKFCNTKTGKPLPLDPDEPRRVAESVKALNLKYAVITSVDRDDLPDQGAEHWVQTIRHIREACPGTGVEVLIPDFQGKTELVDKVCAAGATVVAHNMETVRRLTPTVRSAAKYDVSLSVLQRIAQNGIPAKTGVMLGLGETPEEILQLMDDLIAIDCRILTLGQYLQPTRKHLPVQEYVHPDTFARYKQIALDKGFKHVESGPLVRSSYHAEKVNEGGGLL